MNKLITFIIPTRNLAHLRAQLDQFEKTTLDCSRIEFLIKIDSDHKDAEVFLKEQMNQRPFKIRYISTPRIEGTFSLWIAVEQLFGLVDKDCYFVQVLSDEPYFITPHWDQVLEKYIGLFPDHLFRLRLSDVKFNNYASNYECAFRCDSFPLYTRRWLELTEGTGDCWGSDAYQQLVAFHLGLGTGGYMNFYRLDSVCRDIPVLDLKMGGLDFGVGVSPEMQEERHYRNLKEWNRLSSHKMQEHFSYLARRMFCYIYAKEKQVKMFQLIRDIQSKTVKAVLSDGRVVVERSYKIQRAIVFCQNALRNIRTLYWLQLSSTGTKGYHFIHDSYRRVTSGFVALGLNAKYFAMKMIARSKKIIIMLIKIPLIFLFRLLRMGLKQTFFSKNNLLFLLFKDVSKKLTSFMRVLVVCFKNMAMLRFGRRAASVKMGNEFLALDSPGISVLYKEKCRLTPGLQRPTEEDKKIALSIIDQLQESRDKFRNMEFVSGEHS